MDEKRPELVSETFRITPLTDTAANTSAVPPQPEPKVPTESFVLENQRARRRGPSKRSRARYEQALRKAGRSYSGKKRIRRVGLR